jgi:2-oxoglutarate dehydrogenase E1 component
MFPLPVEQMKELSLYQMLMTMFGHKKSLKHGSVQLYVMNFNLVKWRLASKTYSAPASGSYTRAKRRHADAIKWYLIKIYLDRKLVKV